MVGGLAVPRAAPAWFQPVLVYFVARSKNPLLPERILTLG
jgi:hypothetical protein